MFFKLTLLETIVLEEKFDVNAFKKSVNETGLGLVKIDEKKEGVETGSSSKMLEDKEGQMKLNLD